MTMKKPARLRRGDTVAVLSPSWGGAGKFPRVFDLGLATLRRWGLRIREYPTTRAPDAVLRRDPRGRARDFNAALADRSVKAIFAAIGGDDSIRVLPYLEAKLLRDHPKIVMGYSDTTTLLVWGSLNGVVTFHGPSVMAGLAQIDHLPPAFGRHLHRMLFEPGARMAYRPYAVSSEGYPDWGGPGATGRVTKPAPNTGWRWLQGTRSVAGPLFGGCMEVMEFLKGTRWWPEKEFWNGRILFLETSEGCPSVQQVRWWLMNWGAQGVFDRIAALLVGRPRGDAAAAGGELDHALVDVIRREFGNPDLPIVSRMDFGHTDPQWVLPLGIRARLDCGARTFALEEAWLR